MESATPPKLVYVMGDELDPPDDDVRTTNDDDHVDVIAASATLHGFLQPVAAEQLPGQKRPKLRFGGQRRRASIKAKVPLLVMLYDRPLQPHELQEHQMIENGVRKNLNVVEVGRCIKGRMERMNVTQKQAAKDLFVGETDACIAVRVVEKFSAHPDLLALVEAGKIGKSHAAALARMTDPEEFRRYALLAAEDNVGRDTIRAKSKTRTRGNVRKSKPVKVKLAGFIATFTDPAPQAIEAVIDKLDRAGKKMIRHQLEGSSLPAILASLDSTEA